MAAKPLAPQAGRPGDGALAERLAEARRQLATALLDAERLRAAAGHHRRILKEFDQELRTPLTPILAELAVLQVGADGPLSPRQAKALELVRRNVQRWVATAQRLMTQLQEDAGAEGGRRIDLRAVVEDVLADAHERALKDGLQLRGALPKAPLHVLAPPGALRRAVELLVQQAFVATPAGAGVTVSAHRDRGKVRLEVQDGGPGLSAAELARLGDPAGWSVEGRDAWTLPLLRAALLFESFGGRLTLQSDGEGMGLSRAVELAAA